MTPRQKTKWIEVTRKSRPMPMILIDNAMLGMRQYYPSYHDGKTRIHHYRQAFNARSFNRQNYDELVAMFERNRNKILPWTKQWFRRFTRIVRLVKKIYLLPVASYSKQELKKTFYNFYTIYQHALVSPYDFRFVAEFVGDDISSIFDNHGMPKKQIPNVVEAILTLSQPIDMHHEEIDLITIALRRKKGLSKKTENKLLHKHADKYGYLGMYIYDGTPYGPGYYAKQLQCLTKKSTASLEQSRKKIRQQFSENNKQVSRLIKQYNLNPAEKRLINDIREVINLSMVTDEYYSYIGSRVRPLFMAIARELGVSYNQLLHMRNQEVSAGLTRGLSQKLRQEINDRISHNAIVLKNETITVYSGKAYERYARPYKKELEKIKSQKVIHGETGYPGQVTGTVFVINDLDKIAKFKQGHILVTGATAPQYVPAMKKAKAIITDEGGTLSHAAIMSREFKIPSVIGTTIATRALKTGQRVKIDADKGIIKKNMKQKIKLIIFDCYGLVLNEGYPNTARWLAKQYGGTWKTYLDIMYRRYFNQAAMRDITQQQAWQQTVDYFDLPITWQELRDKHYNLMKIDKRTVGLARKLSKQGYTTLMLSKNTRSQFHYAVTKFKLDKYFDHIMNTWELNLPKASKKTLRVIMKRFKVTPAEIIYADDQQGNLVDPKAMGCRTIYVKNYPQFKWELDQYLRLAD